MSDYHSPVLLKESVDALSIEEQSIIVDVTFGGGGHSREILRHLGDNGKLFAFDQDQEAQKNTIDDPRFTLIDKNFKYMKNFLRLHGVKEVDGVLADLGVSSHQFDKAERGFSTRFDAELDMRMDIRQDFSAKDIINQYEEAELESIFRLYGELPNARRLAHEIFLKRQSAPINTTFELKEAVLHLIPKKQENKFFAMLFQALRIEVNGELDALKQMLQQSVDILKEGGRLVVISYHSLEDRLVKNFMKSGNFEGKIEKDFYGNALVPFKSVSRKIIVPSEEELNINSRSRSAKLRIAEKK